MSNNKFKGKLKQPGREASPTVGLSAQDKAKTIDQNPPEFSLRYLQKGYCIDCCERDEKAALADKMFRLSQLSWSQIRQQDRHKLGYEKIARDAFNTAIPAHVTEDVDLIAFRFCGMAPMVGYKRDATFFILWLDRNYSVYDH
ncbi:hypothetical protein AWY96_05135 [Serratia plymuthica]|uniref:hypothetical protein n=1 Tax=Serratia plymuthica TaxID=82996 RepID=UPI0007A06387|nr:hypothetical protein [Serratia plymuthica]KYQ97917.1 hypothetical protein AWY96_05135 [Serratia plymuthica]